MKFKYAFAVGSEAVWKRAVEVEWKQAYDIALSSTELARARLAEDQRVYARLAGSSDLARRINEALKCDSTGKLASILPALVVMAVHLPRKWARTSQSGPALQISKLLLFAGKLETFTDSITENKRGRLKELDELVGAVVSATELVVPPTLMLLPDHPRISGVAGNVSVRTSLSHIETDGLAFYEFHKLARRFAKLLRSEARELNRAGPKVNWAKGDGCLRFGIYRAVRFFEKRRMLNSLPGNFPINGLIAALVNAVFLTPSEELDPEASSKVLSDKPLDNSSVAKIRVRLSKQGLIQRYSHN